jgi:hypothetical protein
MVTDVKTAKNNKMIFLIIIHEAKQQTIKKPFYKKYQLFTIFKAVVCPSLIIIK